MDKALTKVLAIIANDENIDDAKESLEVVYACAVFDIKIDVMITGNAITQHLLISDNQNSIAKQWQAAPLYGVENIFIVAADVTKLGLSEDCLTPEAKIINTPPKSASYKHIIRL